MKNKTKVFSTSKPVGPKRRRIGEFTGKVKEYKESLNPWQLISLENRINNILNS